MALFALDTDRSEVARRAWETRRANMGPGGQSPAPRAPRAPAVESAPAVVTRKLPNGLPERRIKDPKNIARVDTAYTHMPTAYYVLSGQHLSSGASEDEVRAQVETIAKSLVSDADGVSFTASVNASMSRQMSFQYTAPGVTVSRRFTRDQDGKLSVYHAYFTVSADKQGTGLAKSVLRSSFDTYTKLGVDYVKVGANLDVGGYAWARFGFKPVDEHEWSRLGHSVRSRADALLDAGKISRQKHAEIANITRSSNPADIWSISDQKDKVGSGSLGSSLLKGLSWDGKIDMHDSAQLARLSAYLSKGDDPAKAAQRSRAAARSDAARRAAQVRIRRQRKRQQAERDARMRQHQENRKADALLGYRYSPSTPRSLR